MASLKIVQAGPGLSVQDSGRPKLLRSGIAQGGAIDPVALEEGRLLVGNPRGLAALEMPSPGSRLEVAGEAVCLALTGALFTLKSDQTPVAPYTSFVLQPGQVLDVGAGEGGNYGYLSVAGGIDTPLVLGSRSTHVNGGFGGYKGRCLRRGDLLPVGPAAPRTHDYVLPLPEKNDSSNIRVLWSGQTGLFGESEKQRFVETHFELTYEMDRMGARLTSKAMPIRMHEGLVALSGAIAQGDIQVPGNGRPIVLLADRQPTGGYPRIATIIAADIADFARRPAGSKIRFVPVSEKLAIAALRKSADRLKALPDELKQKTGDSSELHALLSQNLISGVVSGVDQPGKRKS